MLFRSAELQGQTTKVDFLSLAPPDRVDILSRPAGTRESKHVVVDEPEIPSAGAPDSNEPPRTMSVRSFLSETVIYGLGTVGDKLIGLLLIPVATSILGPEGYGILSLFITTAYIALILCSMGIPHAFARFYIESNSPTTRATILDTAFWLSTAGSIVGSGLLLAGGRPLSRWLFDAPELGPLFLLGATTWLSVLEMLGSFRIQADGQIGRAHV